MAAATPANAIWTVGSLLSWTEGYLREKKVESPRLDSQVLLAHVLGCSRSDLYVRFEEVPSELLRKRFRDLIQRRVAGTPVAYLVGNKEFFLLSFNVSPSILIPRSATESLVMATLDRMKARTNPRILDLGTGCGCIAIAIASRLKNARIVATDISAEALAIASENAKSHAVDDRIIFRIGDAFTPVNADENFDAIVSNPPYIPTADIASLAIEVRENEPILALDGGPDGFVVIDQIIAGARARLVTNGYLIFEIGVGQEGEARRKVEAAGFTPEKTVIDGDGMPRVIVSRLH